MMVTLAPPDVAVIVIYFGAVLLIGFTASRLPGEGRGAQAGTPADYLLAGRSLTTPVFVMTLVSTWYGGVLGVGEYTYRFGVSNWLVQGVPYYVFAFVFAFLLAKRVRATNFTTIPDKFHQAYGKPTALLGAFLTFLLMTPAPYVLMVGILLQLVSGWSLWICIVIGTLATSVYLGLRGFRSSVNTDVFEFFLMFLGFGVILPFAVGQFGGLAFIRANVPPLHLTWNGGNSLQFLIVWFFIALWTLVDPAFHQRCYAAKTGSVARRGILWSIVFWVLFDGMTTTAGLYARAVLPSLPQPVMAYPLLAQVILPPVAKGFFFAGMFAAIMSCLNTQVFVSATTLGRDLVLRSRGPIAGTVELRSTRWGLPVTGLLSILLALIFPSVIELWYIIGTAIIPGLLIPLVTSYFPRFTVSSRYAFVSMLLGWGVSTGWFIAGWARQMGSSGSYPLGVEPMYPGLFVSLLVWCVGYAGGRRKGGLLQVRSSGADPEIRGV